MESFDKVVIGFVLFALTSTVAYLFRMRQLYVTSPKLFRHASISKNGSLCEIIVYNKGNQVEENIQVELDPELKGELLASSSSDISLQGSIMKIERLHKGCDASAMLLIENGVLDTTKIVSVSSKGTKGSVVKKVSEVPPNYAKAFLALIAYISFLPGVIYGTRAYEALRGEYIEYRLASLYKQGWGGLEKYYNTDLHRNYGNQEFPLKFVRRQSDSKKGAVLVFDIYNKAACDLYVSANKFDRRPGDIENFASLDVKPMSKDTLYVPDPGGANSSGLSELAFALKCGEEFIYDMKYIIQKSRNVSSANLGL